MGIFEKKIRASSWEDIQKAVYNLALEDPKFRKLVKDSPKEAIQKLTGIKMPDDVKIILEEQKPKQLYLKIPSEPEELDLQNLQNISGGTYYNPDFISDSQLADLESKFQSGKMPIYTKNHVNYLYLGDNCLIPLNNYSSFE